jgi:hypothetical protein
VCRCFVSAGNRFHGIPRGSRDVVLVPLIDLGNYRFLPPAARPRRYPLRAREGVVRRARRRVPRRAERRARLGRCAGLKGKTPEATAARWKRVLQALGFAERGAG